MCLLFLLLLNKDNRNPFIFDFTLQIGSSIKVYGSRYIDTDFALRRKFCWNFLIADVQIAIIGADFLANFGLLVDLKNRRLVDGKTRLRTCGGRAISSIFGVTTIGLCHPFRDLLQEFREITIPTTIGSVAKHDVKHFIQTKGPPVAFKVRRMSPDKVNAARKEFKLMCDLGVCRPSSSSWASPLHCVPKKKDGQWRFAGDNRALNKVSVPDRYPVPHIQDLLYAFQGVRTLRMRVKTISQYVGSQQTQLEIYLQHLR